MTWLLAKCAQVILPLCGDSSCIIALYDPCAIVSSAVKKFCSVNLLGCSKHELGVLHGWFQPIYQFLHGKWDDHLFHDTGARPADTVLDESGRRGTLREWFGVVLHLHQNWGLRAWGLLHDRLKLQITKRQCEFSSLLTRWRPLVPSCWSKGCLRGLVALFSLGLEPFLVANELLHLLPQQLELLVLLLDESPDFWIRRRHRSWLDLAATWCSWVCRFTAMPGVENCWANFVFDIEENTNLLLGLLEWSEGTQRTADGRGLPDLRPGSVEGVLQGPASLFVALAIDKKWWFRDLGLHLNTLRKQKRGPWLLLKRQ